jgi:hypothetical protein
MEGSQGSPASEPRRTPGRRATGARCPNRRSRRCGPLGLQGRKTTRNAAPPSPAARPGAPRGLRGVRGAARVRGQADLPEGSIGCRRRAAPWAFQAGSSSPPTRHPPTLLAPSAVFRVAGARRRAARGPGGARQGRPRAGRGTAAVAGSLLRRGHPWRGRPGPRARWSTRARRGPLVTNAPLSRGLRAKGLSTRGDPSEKTERDGRRLMLYADGRRFMLTEDDLC